MAGRCSDEKLDLCVPDEMLRATENALISDELQELIGAGRSVWVESDDPQGEQLLPPDLQKALARLWSALEPFMAVSV